MGAEAIFSSLFRYFCKMKMKAELIIYTLLIVAGLFSCSDEQYTTSSSYSLEFSKDTVNMDTVFSNIPSSTRDFWVYNRTDRGIRLSSVRLDRGNQSGFRVNVDGVYLGPTYGYQTSGIEVRAGDSIRAFVELTATSSGQNMPRKLHDDLVFELESGVVQKVSLDAHSWDAVILNNPKISTDTAFSDEKPIVIYGSLTVEPSATLTIQAGTHVYFRDEATLNVAGRLVCKGEPGNEVVLRGYRLDNMFDYLPYDRVSGQWGGIHIMESSYGNSIDFTDIHSAYNGVVVDSCSTDRVTLTMNSSTVHNCQGYGIASHHSRVEINNCQLSNTLKDCFYTDGGVVKLNNCTLAQFYPFDYNRGAALHFTAEKGNLDISCANSLLTGYADDELLREQMDTMRAFEYRFEDCIIRTPKIVSADSVRFVNVIFEAPEDTVSAGKKHFLNIDTDNLIYDFRLDSVSTAIDKGNPLTAMPADRNGIRRDEKPDIGAFEIKK